VKGSSGAGAINKRSSDLPNIHQIKGKNRKFRATIEKDLRLLYGYHWRNAHEKSVSNFGDGRHGWRHRRVRAG
jgi:hypothetical protein